MAENLLYYGDNLDVMRRHIKDESVDLVYLDPPFKSDRNYNILFKERNGYQAASQIRAFEDTWMWNLEDKAIYDDLCLNNNKLSDVLQGFYKFLGECDMMAYLVMMSPRLVEMKRAMKHTASIYLHCDSSASHYLKILMDAIFGPENFRNEILWKRNTPHANTLKKFPVSVDSILFYAKSEDALWLPQFTEYRNGYVDKYYSLEDSDGRKFQPTSLLGHKGSNPEYEWRGIVRHWRYPIHRLEELDASGLIYWPEKGGIPRFKRFLDEQKGLPVEALWTDIPPINSQAAERLGYPTQKPVALLERIISASSNPGDVILDPFCGCGTTISAAQSLDRQWVGIDITHLAITLIKKRLNDAFGDSCKFTVIGEPVSVPDAERLAESDPYQFQWWALGLVGARPVEQKKGADKGIDGRIIFEGDKQGHFESVILSVKAGKTGAAHVRDLKGVLDREKAAIGVLISMQEPTSAMRTEAVTAGFYESALWGKKYPRVQLLTVAELLSGKKVDMPPLRQVGATFKKAPKSAKKQEQAELQV